MDLGSDKAGAISEPASNEPKISLHALTRSLNPKTMQVKGNIERQQVVLLIDSSRTHNFIDPMVANGELLASARSCEIVRIGIQGE